MRWDLTNEKDINQIKKRVETAYAKLAGRDSDSEDCFQEILCGMLEGKGQHQTIDQAVIDYLRKQCGRKGSRSYHTRQKLKAYTSLNDIHSLAGSDGSFLGERTDIERLLRHCDRTDRAIYILKEKWGFLETEIADIFGVGASRINKRIKRMEGRLSERVEKETTGQSKRKREMEKVLSEKTGGNRWRLESFKVEGLERFESF